MPSSSNHMILSHFHTNHGAHSLSQVPKSPVSLCTFFCRRRPNPMNASAQSSLSSNEARVDELLELCWFFENLLIRRSTSRFPSSWSDPCLSDVAHQVFVEIPDPAGDGRLASGGGKRRNLLRTPSLPCRMRREEGVGEAGDGSGSRPLLEEGVLVECSGDHVSSAALDMDVLPGNGGGKHRNLLRMPSLPPRMDREEGICEKGNGSRPLLEHGVLVRSPGDHVSSSGLDVDISLGNGGGKPRNLLRAPSLPSRMDREEVIREKRNGSSPLIEHGVLVQSPDGHVSSSALDMDVPQGNGGSRRRNLLRSPSLPARAGGEEGIREKGNGSKLLSEHGLLQKPAKPPYVERKEEGTCSKESSGTRRSKPARKPRHTTLLRTPSLPPCIGREKEFGEKEAAARIRNSTQPNLSEFFPTRQEILEKNYSLPMCPIPTSNDEMWHQFLVQMRRRRSQRELESEEVQGFKDLGFSFDEKDMNPTVADIIPGLREKKEEDLESERGRSRREPYLSEAWMLQTHLLPPIPKWDSRKSAQDMKQQIKFWARAVASNVH